MSGRLNEGIREMRELCSVWLWVWLMASLKHSEKKVDDKKGESVTFSMSLALWPQERNTATPVEEKLHRPAGGLTYCISAG